MPTPTQPPCPVRYRQAALGGLILAACAGLLARLRSRAARR